MYIIVPDRPKNKCNNAREQKNKQRGHSSAGRAPPLQGGGRRFDPAWLHHHYRWMQQSSFDNEFIGSRESGCCALWSTVLLQFGESVKSVLDIVATL